MTNEELTAAYNTLVGMINNLATWAQVDNLVDTQADDYAALADLIETLSERIEALEAAYLNHMVTYHSS